MYIQYIYIYSFLNVSRETADALENNGTEEGDYELAMTLTANLLTIELIHRLLVIFYEVWFTHTQGGITWLTNDTHIFIINI